MAYLKDIRENSIGEAGKLWEADNRVEERYYWNGAYIDFCDLPPEEYGKTIFVTSGDNSTAPSIKNKNMVLSVTTDGDLQIDFSGSLTSALFISVTYNNGVDDVVITKDFPAGTANPLKFGLTDAVSVGQYGIGTTEDAAIAGNKSYQDDEYKYQITYKAPVVYPIAYFTSLPKGAILTMSDDDIRASLLALDTIDMASEVQSIEFVATLTPIDIPLNEWESLTMPQKSDKLIAVGQDSIIVTDKEIISIANALANIEEFSVWTKKAGTIDIDGKAFSIWYKTPNDTEMTKVHIIDGDGNTVETIPANETDVDMTYRITYKA